MKKYIVVDLDCDNIPIRADNLKELEKEIKGYFLHEYKGSKEECPQNLTECVEFLIHLGMKIFKTEDCINIDLI